MVACIIYVEFLFLSVFLSYENASDICLSLCSRAKRRRIRQHCFEELQRHDFTSFIHDRFYRSHSHVFQTAQVGKITLSECHEETDPFYPRDIERQRLNLLMVEQVHVFLTDLREIIHPLDLHGFCLHPVSVFPVGTFRGNLPDIDLRVEICGKRITVVACIAVQNIDIIYLIKVVLQGISRKHARNSRIETASQQSRKTGLLVFFPVGPLPFIFELGRIFRLIISRIYIMYSGRQAGVHDRQVLIWQRQVQDDLRLLLSDQLCQFVYMIRIYLSDSDLRLCRTLQFLFQRVTL